MIRRLAPLVAFSLVLLSACGSPTEPVDVFRLGEPFWIAEGGVALAEDGLTTVRFIRVVGDSRCRGGDILCIWAGDATAEFGVRVGMSDEQTVELNLMLDPRSARLQLVGRTIEFSGLEGTPVPMSAVMRGYRARLVVNVAR